ncbi:MAG TPA: ribosome small subunit-dependent GTPase A [Candidatus Solibacter sp.]|nr:ribosome small subunit-dependent GTPase A [Candidatus Solibacter sp.]
MSTNFEAYAARGLVLARVISSQRDQYRLAANSQEFSAEPSGALWYGTTTRAGMPVVGDWVAARVVGDAQAIVDAVMPRRTFFSRRSAGRAEAEQAIAANIDVVFVVCGLDGDFNVRRIERYLALTVESGAGAVIVLNKSDLCEGLQGRIAETQAVAAGAPVIPTTTMSADGLDELRAFLNPGLTIALLGSSGAGKSSIVNALLGCDRQRVSGVREHDSRGRHTTTYRELIELPGGAALIDTPGMRELQLWVSQESVEAVFDEIAERAAACRFRDCTHSGEPGCAVVGAVAEDRLASFHKLRREAQHHEVMADPLAAQERKRKWKVIHKAMRHNPKQ